MLRDFVQFLTVVFFTSIVLFSSLILADRTESSTQQSIYQLEEVQGKVEGSIAQASQASLFRHLLQQPLWIGLLIIDEFFASRKADANFYSEPIKYHWFDLLTISSYRVSQWKESNSQFRQLAIADQFLFLKSF